VNVREKGEVYVKVVIWKSPRLCVPLLKKLFRFGRDREKNR